MLENEGNRTYLCIDLKSFYASVECADRGLDPLDTNLVVADTSRTEKTICLAVSPSLKAYGIPGRARLFEVSEKVREINSSRAAKIKGRKFSGKSISAAALSNDDTLKLSYIAATPRMALYMDISTEIYRIYLRYVSSEDIHVYSIDEVFMDVTGYLKTYGLTARELAVRMMHDVLKETGITATAGIGTNMYLAKIAMDVLSKHVEADENGVRVAELDEMKYRRELWDHTPITDFWRVGRGYARRLAENGLYTMGDVARCSIGAGNTYHNEELLYRLFGVNAELLIDHAWGFEPCLMSDVKKYKPKTNSLGAGQVLMEPYTYEKALLIITEMAESLALDLFAKKLAAGQIVLMVGYDTSNLENKEIMEKYKGPVERDYYGRPAPKSAHGSHNLSRHTSSERLILEAVHEIAERVMDPVLLVRRIGISAEDVISEEEAEKKNRTETAFEQLDLFTDFDAKEKKREEEDRALEREKKMQEAVLKIKTKFGKNALLKGHDLEKGATAKQRNEQIGGHKA